jgi:DNA-binding transcriptional MerR regulator
MADALTVGEFSRITHLSVRTLRHYHEVGLLEPANVSRATGYRYYSHEQIPTAQVIRRLRDLEMSVADVKAVLVAPDLGTRNLLIAAHLDRLEAELVQTYAAVDALRKLLESGDSPAVEYRTAPEVAAIAVRQVVDRSEILPWWQGALGELHATVRAQDLRTIGPSGALFASEIYQHDRGEALVFIPVDGEARTLGRVEPFDVPGSELVIATHHGSLADIDITYGKLGAYVTTHEIGIEGPLREYYLREPNNAADPSDGETEIGWPIFRSDRAQS